MREAKAEIGNRKWEIGDDRRALGFDFGELRARLDGYREIAENALQAAGYLVLTGGAVWLLFRFAA